MTIKEQLSKLREIDIYSLLLFALYKIKNIPEYSTLSELSYVLDKHSLLNLCEYFGGLTITVPTIDELEDILNAMLLYQYVDIDNYTIDKAITKLGFESKDLRRIKKNYSQLSTILEDYDFVRE